MGGLIQYIVSRACRSRFLSRVIFRIDFKPLGKEDYYFDVTTSVLLKKALKNLKRNSRVLDMGTGASCVIGLSLWKRLGCHITASDINPEIIALAQKNIRRNQAPIRVINSRLFNNVDETFDMVIFNPPYVPTKIGKTRNLSERRRSQWDGGADGADVIKDFLDAFRKLDYPLTALVGVNFLHVGRKKVLGFLKGWNEISIEEIYRHPILPVDVYMFRRHSLCKG